MATMDGRITLVQESRFQLTDEAGVSHLFTLSPWCAAEPAQLRPLAHSQAPVRVTYKAGVDVIGQVAQRIDVQAEAGR
ncbi:hypothetical protein D3273_12490 [Lichenibacterium minor]|jgi:hypothetical protein|uniref:Uncharacterized protein n=1 Tax=Lichenibacterium minor TaxID=2316528 RepID=A0A4Q2U530_9HYPH|nr:hypothetical protein [Lichenibacterium minor]RYC31689.1 hypothetical protein D3273_12490 [Lichenibacterium minor]